MRIIEPPNNFGAVVNQEEKKYRDEIEDTSSETAEAWVADKMPYYRAVEQTAVLQHVRGRVLELGAGRCWLTALLSRFPEVTEIYAVDLSEKLLKELAPKTIAYLQGQTKKINLVLNDFNNLDFPLASFDTIIFDAALHHARDPIATLNNIKKFLKPDGHIICIREPIIPPVYYFNKKAVYRAHGVTEKQYGVTENIFSLKEWRRIFQGAELQFVPVKVPFTMIRNPLLKKIFGYSVWNGLLYSEIIFIGKQIAAAT